MILSGRTESGSGFHKPHIPQLLDDRIMGAASSTGNRSMVSLAANPRRHRAIVRRASIRKISSRTWAEVKRGDLSLEEAVFRTEREAGRKSESRSPQLRAPARQHLRRPRARNPGSPNPRTAAQRMSSAIPGKSCPRGAMNLYPPRLSRSNTPRPSISTRWPSSRQCRTNCATCSLVATLISVTLASWTDFRVKPEFPLRSGTETTQAWQSYRLTLSQIKNDLVDYSVELVGRFFSRLSASPTLSQNAALLSCPKLAHDNTPLSGV